ncbi:MAG: DUF2284 domain-containing protein [Treponema sp.]|nr:DUF2284 domain-containing protein [Treponema sp.]
MIESTVDPQKLLVEISAALGVSVREWAVIQSDKIVFSPELLDYCKTNVCGNYNKSWSCPPACESINKQKEKILSFKNVLIFTTVRELEDTFDYEGMEEGRRLHNLLTIEIQNRLDGVPVYGAGGCPVCEGKNGENKNACAYPNPCLFPEKRIGTIEAAGIDVTALSKTAKITYNNGQNSVTFFSLALFDK